MWQLGFPSNAWGGGVSEQRGLSETVDMIIVNADYSLRFLYLLYA